MTHVSAAILPFPSHGFVPGDEPAFLSPADMAQRLRQTYRGNARCFAETMHEDSAWANDNWGAYWADVLRLV